MALDLNDKTSSGNNLTNVNSVADSASTPFSGGNTDSALFTRSSSKYLKTGTSPSNLNLTTGLTIEAWINPTTISTATLMAIVARYGTSPGALQYTLQLNRNTNGKLTFLGSTDGTNANASPGDSSGAITTAYHHIAFAMDGVNYSYYIDGSPSGAGAFSTTLVSLASQALSIGADNIVSPGDFFDGNIDEVRIWNVKRTDAQILANYNIQLSNPLDSSLVGYWPFNAIASAQQDEGLLFSTNAAIEQRKFYRNKIESL